MARSFNGSSDLITSGGVTGTGIPNPGSPISVATWVWMDSVPPGTYRTVDRFYHWGLEYNVVKHCFYELFVSSGASNNYLSVNNSSFPPINSWHHMGMTYDGTTLTGYLDGISQGSSSSLSSIGSPVIGTQIGFGAARPPAGQGVPSDFLNGELAESAVWSACLSTGEMAGLASGVSTSQVRPRSLVGYWPLYGLASPEPDLSGNANNGTLTGTAYVAHAPVSPFTWTRWSYPTLPSIPPPPTSFQPACAARSNLAFTGGSA